MIAKSITILRKNIGIVILVGKAARLVTGGIPIAAIIHGQTIKLVPESITNRSVIGVMMQPCLAIINRSRQGNE